MSINGNDYAYVDRNIYLYGEINSETALEIISAIKHINKYDDMLEDEVLSSHQNLLSKGIIKGDIEGLPPREPIMLEINSGGGHTSAGFSIITAIENSDTPIIGYVTGDCMSMATAVLASTDYRMSTEYARFMIHDVYSATEGKYNDLKNSLQYIQHVRDNYNKVLEKYTDMESEELNDIADANADKHFSPEDAIEMGLVDSIDSDEDFDEALMMHKLYGIPLPDEEDEKGVEEDYVTEAKEALKEIGNEEPSEKVERLEEKIAKLEAFIGDSLDMEE